MTPVNFAGHFNSDLLEPQLDLLEFEPAENDLRLEVLSGLSLPQKALPCKLFYDQAGSKLFDLICGLPEYYPTRTELEIMRENRQQIADSIGRRTLVVEYGSGSSLKTRLLLDDVRDMAGYVPIDISRAHLLDAARSLASQYQHVPIRPVCADYTRQFWLPDFDDQSPERVLAYFPGSTIGNFELDQALAFLQSIRETCGPRSGLLIGVDLKKDPAILHHAYNDDAGVTAKFNLNILRHVNIELGSNFDQEAFAHYAFYNPRKGRMEMHLVSRRTQSVKFSDDVAVCFEQGESIHTESCHKFTLQEFRHIAGAAGYHRLKVWTDPNQLFSVQLFHAAD